ncbi:MAG: M20/M25/M40 family metallo-hydrolase, partial [Phycisphaerae bacterium]|nr:M20/M25/M40 family metallo-hydrolase [Saprospiraceae bacterium]
MKYFFLTVATTLLAYSAAFSQQSSISERKLHKHVAYLASDKLKGRATGTPEEIKAANYIAKQFRQIGLAPKGDNGTFFHKFGFKKSSDPHGGVDENAKQVYSQNVAAYLDNGAPYTIVIGGHYDHLGLGHDHNSLDANPEGKIHNGADDNASGTAGVIELARYFAKNGVKEQHNFLFLCFSGEELGLYGSKKYTEFPTIDLSQVSFMINMDMIGRLNAEKKLVVGGVGTAPDFVPTLKGITTGLSIKLDSAGVGPSDHTSFYLKNIPVLFFFTGQHSDYHKPSDDIEKVNFKGEIQVVETVVQVIQKLDNQPKLKFQETKSKESTNASFKVTLGIMPDYTY